MHIPIHKVFSGIHQVMISNGMVQHLEWDILQSTYPPPHQPRHFCVDVQLFFLTSLPFPALNCDNSLERALSHPCFVVRLSVLNSSCCSRATCLQTHRCHRLLCAQIAKPLLCSSHSPTPPVLVTTKGPLIDQVNFDTTSLHPSNFLETRALLYEGLWELKKKAHTTLLKKHTP